MFTSMPRATRQAAMNDPVGIQELTRRLGVQERTGHHWWYLKALPPPDYDSVNGTRAWEWITILLWAGRTGRLTPGSPDADEYTRLTGLEPALPYRAAGQGKGNEAIAAMVGKTVIDKDGRKGRVMSVRVTRPRLIVHPLDATADVENGEERWEHDKVEVASG